MQTEMVPEVEDSLAVGLRVDGDVEVVLFVKLVPMVGEGGGGEGQPSQNVSDKRFCDCARRSLETVQDLYVLSVRSGYKLYDARFVRCNAGDVRKQHRVKDCHDLHDPTVSGLVYFDTMTGVP